METLELSQLGTLLLSLALLIGVARLLGELARRLQQPAVLGEMLAGVLLGPTFLGALAPELQAVLFPTTGPNAVILEGIVSLAIVLFLLVAGMEVDLSIVWKQGRSALLVGTFGTVIPFGMGLLAAVVMPAALGRQTDANPLIFTLFLATAMAISSLPVIAKTLMDLDLYRTDVGMVVVSAAIFNDLIGWTIFALVLGMMDSAGSSLAFGYTLFLTLLFAFLVLTIGRWLVHRILPLLQAYTHYPGGVIGFGVTAGLVGAALTEFIGVHAVFGAFLVGVAFGDSPHLQARTRVMFDNFTAFVFAPLFFASIGLKTNFATHFDARIVFTVIAVACVGKILGTVLGARVSGFAQRERWAIAFGMNARGAMEIILGTLALEAGIIDQRLFVALVAMAIFTSAVSGPLIRWALRRPKPYRVASLLSPKLFLPRLEADSRFGAIRELAALAAAQSGLDASAIVRQAWQRELIDATGIRNGVAIPRAQFAELKEPLVAVGISEAGLPFDSPDGQPAQVLLLIVTPSADQSIQHELAADISRLFRDPSCLDRTLRAKNFTELLAAFKSSSAI